MYKKKIIFIESYFNATYKKNQKTLPKNKKKIIKQIIQILFKVTFFKF